MKKIDFTEFIKNNSERKNSFGKRLILPKEDLKEYYSDKFHKNLVSSIESNFDRIEFGFLKSIIVLNDGGILSNSINSSGEEYKYSEVIKFSVKTNGMFNKGSILDGKGKTIGICIGNDSTVGIKVFEEFLKYIKTNSPRTTSEDVLGNKDYSSKENVSKFPDDSVRENNESFEFRIKKINQIDKKILRTIEQTESLKQSVLNLKKPISQIFEKYSNEDWVLNHQSIKNKEKQPFFFNIWSNSKGITDYSYGLVSGVGYTTKNELVFLPQKKMVFSTKLSERFNDLISNFKIKDENTVKVNGNLFVYSKNEILFLTELKEEIQKRIQKYIHDESIWKIKEERKRKDEERKRKDKEQDLLRDIENKVSVIEEEFDKDKNGFIDIIDIKDDFRSLLVKNQERIIQIDPSCIQKFIKLDNYLKDKRENIQSIFSFLKKSKSIEDFDDSLGIMRNKIQSYELLLFHSLNMIVSLTENNLITYYEIYESFDKLGIWDSNWEKNLQLKLQDLSNEIQDLGHILNKIVRSINEMEMTIINEISSLKYLTENSFENLNQSLSNQLKEINSSLSFNNLLTGISTYQLYKINKNTRK